MKIRTDEFVTEVSDIASLSELPDAELGDPCLLIVHGSGISADGTDSAAADLLTNAPFVTALADDEPDNSIAELFDMVIPTDDISGFTAKLFKDKTRFQAKQINTCFIAARKGSQADILDCESRAFYRLLADKIGGSSNE